MDYSINEHDESDIFYSSNQITTLSTNKLSPNIKQLCLCILPQVTPPNTFDPMLPRSPSNTVPEYPRKMDLKKTYAAQRHKTCASLSAHCLPPATELILVNCDHVPLTIVYA